jgi:ATP-binding cassette subfamily B protein
MEALASVDLVRNVEIFARLTERQLEAIVRAGRLTAMRGGARLLKAGVAPTELSIVLTGHVRVVDERGDSSAPFDVLGPGAHFGETLLDATPAPFSIYAQTDGDLLVLGRRELDRLAVDWPDVEPTLLDHLMRRHRVEDALPDDAEVVRTFGSAVPVDSGVVGTARSAIAGERQPSSGPSHQSAAFDADGHIEWRRRAFVPTRRRFRKGSLFVRQIRPSDSGPACLASVCRYYGHRVTLNALREASDSVRADARLAGLRRAADSLGFETLAATVTWRELSANGCPTVVKLSPYRWVTILSVTGDSVAIVDPDLGPRALPQTEFIAQWTGEALFLRPTPAFAELSDPPPTFARLLPYLRPLQAVVVELTIAALVIEALSLALPIFARFAIDDVIARRDERWLLPAVEIMAAVLALSLVTSVSRRSLLQFVSQQIDSHLGGDFFAHLLALPVKFFERRTVGDTASRLDETRKLTDFLTGYGAAFVFDMATATLSLGLLIYYSFPLAMVALGCVAVEVLNLAIITPYLDRGVRELVQNARESEGLLIESLAGLKTIKILAIEHYTRWSLESRLIRQINTSLRLLRYGAAATVASELLSTGSTLAVLFYGAVLVSRGRLSVGELVAAGILTRSITAPFAMLAAVWHRLQDARHSVEQVNDVFDTATEAGREPGADQTVLHRLNGHVRLDRVSFHYEAGGADVLHDVSFEAYAGQRVAIVGPSGSGKSTLIKLLLGFYRPTSGRVTIDGFDLADVWLPSLRRQLGVVLQDSRLFHTTIRANISLALPGASLQDVTTVARMVNAHQWIGRLPRGYETVLEEDGLNLSGGQRQQLSLARALIQSRRLLILDEATSNLDSESERLCHQNINLRFKDSTIITITQRLQTIRHADLIIVMDRGTVVEQGDHDQLMARQGLYARLFIQQSA